MDKQEILRHLSDAHPWAGSLQFLDCVDSTNTYAKALARQGAPQGTAVVASLQTGGRGRLGRSFSSPEGLGLYLSVILRPQCRPDALMHLTCAAGVAAADAVEQAAGLRPKIKWTNDLVLGQRKLGGILTELSVTPTGLVDFAVIGIGINCLQDYADFPPEIRDMACSLKTETAACFSPALIAARMLESIEAMDLQKPEDILTRFRADCITLGREISLCRGEEIRHGKAVDIGMDGSLTVLFSDGHRESVHSGEVSIRGMYGYV